MNQQRLYFFDWIRILAFCLLILYHTGMYNSSGTFLTVTIENSPLIHILNLANNFFLKYVN